MQNDIRRIEVKLTEDIRGKVEEYAKDKGLRLPWAYGELIKKGLEN